jgi:hypothetical protein
MRNANWRVGILAVLTGVALAACRSEESAPVAPQNPGNPPPAGQTPANNAPTITGTPTTSVMAGRAYNFFPGANDADADPLTFSATGLPAWARIAAQTGAISGTPATGDVGQTGDIVVSVTDGKATTSLSAFRITVVSSTPPPASNNPPTISGTPPGSVAAGAAYTFTPVANDPDGNVLAFSITGKPGWVAFSTATGALTGTPVAANIGTYTGIVITVSDGLVSRALPAFSINVTQNSSGNGSATLSWSPPTQNTDGSPATDLAGYRVYHGMSVSALSMLATVPGATTASYVANQLGSGTHYFAVAAYTSSGMESALSAVGSKTIP